MEWVVQLFAIGCAFFLCTRVPRIIRRWRARELRSVVLHALLRQTEPVTVDEIGGGSRAVRHYEIGLVLSKLPSAWFEISRPFGHEDHYELTAEGRAAAEEELK